MQADDDQRVTHWLTLLKSKDHKAAQPLWELYFNRLVRLVRARLPASPSIDEEGLAASAFRSFWLGAANGRFPRLDDRHDLWRVLVTVAGQKISDELARVNTLKRGGGVSRVDAALELVVGREPSPEMAAMVADELQRLLDRLGSDEYRRIALWKMDGFTNEEIGEKLGCAVRTVANRLDVIRTILSEEAR